MHHQFGSRFLIDRLHKHGFCCSYAEVTKFERSAAISHGTDIPNLTERNVVQYVADNVDHNIRTLDGHNTFHGMGMIATVTPGTSIKKSIPRISVTTEEIAAVAHVNIEHFMTEHDGLRSLCYQKLKEHDAEDPTSNADVLWNISLPLRSSRPGWTGMMQMIHNGDHPGQSSVMFMPMIDMNPSDMTCVYSTLQYVNSHARRHNATPILTFDQPLWWKALTIQESSQMDSDMRKIVLRLGGFHTQMSFLGAMGHIMAGSGLEELLECVYAPNVVGHMLSGKAISRAIRGHMLVSGALYSMLVCQVFNLPLPNGSDKQDDEEVGIGPSASEVENNYPSESDEVAAENGSVTSGEPFPELLNAAGTLYDDIMAGSISVDSLQNSDILQSISQQIEEAKKTMEDRRTARLWLQYMEMVDILFKFIKAERTGNWDLHLKMVHKMLPYLSAAGHHNYTKSLHIYPQKMDKLKETHPEVYSQFQEGHHVIRRSDRFWAGLSTDLVIEQVLMRSVKTTGGLTRGRGMSETQRSVWLLSTPACAEVNLAMQELTSVIYAPSEQHKEVSDARKEKDMADTKEILSFLTLRNPFHENPALHSLVTGVTAADSVNVDSALSVGEKILNDLDGKNVLQHSFRKKDQVVTLRSSSAVSIKEDVIHIDPQLLFQRLVTAGKQTDNLEDVFQYELCSYPPALFESKWTPRLANKASLADTLWKSMPGDMPVPTGEALYILDGGALLHRVPWQRGLTYDEICQQYVRYVGNHYGSPTIVFDGYSEGPSTKDATQQRRAAACIGATVNFSGSMLFKGKKEDFLTNKENKHSFLALLKMHLESQGCHTEQARADADLLIVQTAIAALEETTKPTILVGDDTDLLVLLCFHTKMTTSNLYFRPEPRHGTKKAARCWSISELKTKLGPQVCDNICSPWM